MLESCSPDRTAVLPLLFSDGYFYSERLAPLLASLGIAVWPPLIDWPRFAPFLIDAIASHAAASTGEPVILMVGHGSSRDERAAKAAERLAIRLSSRFRDVRRCFLEQPPFALEAFGRIDASYAAVGLFLGAGLHGGEDFPALVSAAPSPPQFAFTVGRLKGLGELIAHEARDAIDRLAG
jgi:sirohydrochlorin ferrochelatase